MTLSELDDLREKIKDLSSEIDYYKDMRKRLHAFKNGEETTINNRYFNGKYNSLLLSCITIDYTNIDNIIKENEILLNNEKKKLNKISDLLDNMEI